MLDQLKDLVEKKGWIRLWFVVGLVMAFMGLFAESEGLILLGILAIGLGWVLRWVVRGFE
tara:strand:+ start:428 stop:607 length:180 start_codon:yes stop_codon:yes gene_type:complete